MRVWAGVLAVAGCLGGVALAHAAPAAAGQPPIRAPGLWHVSGYVEILHDGHEVKVPIGNAAEELVRCVDVASEMKALEAERTRKTCPVRFGRNGQDFTLETDCTLANGTAMKTMALLTVQSYAAGEAGRQMTAYHVGTVVESSAFSGFVSKTWTRIGACPIGTSGGDVGVIRDGRFHKLMGGAAAAMMDGSPFAH